MDIMQKDKFGIPRPRSYFMSIKCPSCNNKQILFSAATSPVQCAVCNQELGKSGASRIKLKGIPGEVYE
tara:strand:+ start:301 stop:507 length:207 start_codon:yes stop_codon:yes gene_type:complete